MEIIRKERNLSQGKLSNQSGISKHQISLYETRNADINHATVSRVYALAQALDCKVEDLLELENIKF